MEPTSSIANPTCMTDVGRCKERGRRDFVDATGFVKLVVHLARRVVYNCELDCQHMVLASLSRIQSDYSKHPTTHAEARVRLQVTFDHPQQHFRWYYIRQADWVENRTDTFYGEEEKEKYILVARTKIAFSNYNSSGRVQELAVGPRNRTCCRGCLMAGVYSHAKLNDRMTHGGCVSATRTAANCHRLLKKVGLKGRVMHAAPVAQVLLTISLPQRFFIMEGLVR